MKKKTNIWIERMNDENEDAMYPTGHDNAIIGIGRIPCKNTVFIISTKIIIKNLMKDGLSREDAEEFFSYNIIGSYNGENSPFYINDYWIAEEK